uniref:Si:dkey-190l8.2 n=1 Tax=Petromyzon marinus TaxID=7757 RepID=S4R7S9_PETMA
LPKLRDSQSEAYSLQDFKFYTQTTFMVGLLVGSIAMGIASDRYGRRPVLLGCVASQGAAEFVIAFLPNFPTYLLGRLLTGTTASGIMLCSFSLGVEWCGPALRAWPPIILALAFSVGMMALAGVAKISQNWPQLHLATGVPQLMVLLLFWSLPESPRWLFLKKRTTEARNLLRQASIINRRSEVSWTPLRLTSKLSTRGANESTLLITFRNRTLRKRLLIMSYICAAVSMTYYGLCLSVGDFGLDIHMAQFLSGLAEIPQLLLPPLMRRVGRRSLCIVFLSVAGATCLLCLPLQPNLANVVVALALLGKLCAQVTACVATLYRIELFPTNVRPRCHGHRQNALGAVAMCGSVGSLLAPLVNRAALVLGVSALSVHGCLPLAGAALALLLPETRRAPFPDSVEECERQP